MFFKKNKKVELENDMIDAEISEESVNIEETITEETEELEIYQKNYNYIRYNAPYLNDEDNIDPSYLLMDIGIDGYDSIETKTLTYNASIIPLNNNIGGSILDFGCGVGDLYGHLVNIHGNSNLNYTGIDFNKNKVNLSKLKYKDITTFVGTEDDIIDPYDYIACINVFNYNIYKYNFDKMYEIVHKLFNLTNKCMIFNTMNERMNIENTDVNVNYTFDQINYILKDYEFFMHRTDYLYGESMIYLFKPHSL